MKISIEDKKFFANQLVKIRSQCDLSQADLCVKIDAYLRKRGEKREFRQATISNWERANNYPRKRYIDALCDIFDVDETYFINESKKENILKFEKIDVDNIERYASSPVYVYFQDEDIGMWGIVTSDGSYINMANETKIPVIRVKESIYSCPIPFSYGIDSNCKPLNATQLKKLEKFWVEGVGGSYEARQKVKGWYQYDKQRDEIYNGNYDYLSMDGIGKSWIAFKDCVDDFNNNPEKV